MSGDDILNKINLPAGIHHWCYTSREAIRNSMSAAGFSSSTGGPVGPPLDVTLRLLKSVKKVTEFLGKSNAGRVSLERDILIGLLKDMVTVINMACIQEVKLESKIGLTQYQLHFCLSDHELARMNQKEERGVVDSLIESHITGQLPALMAEHAILCESVNHEYHRKDYVVSLFLGQKIDP